MKDKYMISRDYLSGLFLRVCIILTSFLDLLIIVFIWIFHDKFELKVSPRCLCDSALLIIVLSRYNSGWFILILLRVNAIFTVWIGLKVTSHQLAQTWIVSKFWFSWLAFSNSVQVQLCGQKGVASKKKWPNWSLRDNSGTKSWFRNFVIQYHFLFAIMQIVLKRFQQLTFY